MPCLRGGLFYLYSSVEKEVGALLRRAFLPAPLIKGPILNSWKHKVAQDVPVHSFSILNGVLVSSVLALRLLPRGYLRLRGGLRRPCPLRALASSLGWRRFGEAEVEQDSPVARDVSQPLSFVRRYITIYIADG